jgi:P4 family phage/plasmid primase-like protien
MTTAALSTPKDFAYYYRDGLGFSVFVLKTEPARKRKEPAVLLLDTYLKRKPTDEEIELWFKINPNYNLGIPMGTVSQAIGFDIDGQNAIERIRSKIPEMSSSLREAFNNTMKTRTGSGSEHTIFKVEGPIDDINKRQLWTDGQPHSQILMLANKSYVVAAPSLHPNNKRYEWNGKEPQTITLQELNEFIRLISPSNQESTTKQDKPHMKLDTNHVESQQATTITTRALTSEQMQELLSWVKPFYTPGNRDHIIFYLSGMMRKTGGFSLDTARRFIRLLCDASGYSDEDLDKSLTVVDNTYRKPLNELNGKSGLHDLLVTSYETTSEYDKEQYNIRAETFSQICQIINGEPSSPEELPNGNGIKVGGSDDEHKNNDSGPAGQWLELQMEANKDLDIISTLCDEVLRLGCFKTLSDTREIRWYDNGTYLSQGENRIHEMLEKLGGYYVSSHVRNEVIEHIKIRTLTDRSKFDKDVHLVNARNCVIDLRSGECLPHDPERYLFTQQIPLDYKPHEIRTPRKILDFLYNVMHPSDVPLVIEFIGYCLIKDCRFQKALMIAGPPDSGKSKFLELLERFFGADNIVDKTIHQLTLNRFATASLFGKLVNIFADLSSRRLRDIEMFKVLVAGDRISAERKFLSDFDFRPYAKLIFSSNLPPLPPEDSDDEDAFYKRWFVVSFNLRKSCLFCDEKIERDPNLLEKLTTDEELSGLLYLAIKAAQRLLLRGRFTKSPSIEATQEEYERKANPVKAWSDVRCIISEEYETDKERMEEDYEDFCYRNKLPVLNRVHLARELKKIYSSKIEDMKRGSRGNQKHYWKGIGLRKDLRESGQLDLMGIDDHDHDVEIDESEDSL